MIHTAPNNPFLHSFSCPCCFFRKKWRGCGSQSWRTVLQSWRNWRAGDEEEKTSPAHQGWGISTRAGSAGLPVSTGAASEPKNYSQSVVGRALAAKHPPSRYPRRDQSAAQQRPEPASAVSLKPPLLAPAEAFPGTASPQAQTQTQSPFCLRIPGIGWEHPTSPCSSADEAAESN